MAAGLPNCENYEGKPMQAKNLGSLLTVLTVLTVGASVQAAPQAAVVKTATPQVAVVVKIGSAMQEEYIGGEPTERTTIYLTRETAQKSATAKAKPQS